MLGIVKVVVVDGVEIVGEIELPVRHSRPIWRGIFIHLVECFQLCRCHVHVIPRSKVDGIQDLTYDDAIISFKIMTKKRGCTCRTNTLPGRRVFS